MEPPRVRGDDLALHEALGRPRDVIDAAWGPASPAYAWREHGEGRTVRYEDGTAVEVRLRVDPEATRQPLDEVLGVSREQLGSCADDAASCELSSLGVAVARGPHELRLTALRATEGEP